MLVACGDSLTYGAGLIDSDDNYANLLSKKLKLDCLNLAKVGASEYMILQQVIEAVKLKPSIIIVGHTSEYRWHLTDKTGEVYGYSVFQLLNFLHGKQFKYRSVIEAGKKEDFYMGLGMYYCKSETIVHLWESLALRIAYECRDIPTIHINMFGHLEENFKNILKGHICDFPLAEKAKIYPGTDKFHPNEEQHIILAERIFNEYDNLLWR